jgi:hypothetical protein
VLSNKRLAARRCRQAKRREKKRRNAAPAKPPVGSAVFVGTWATSAARFCRAHDLPYRVRRGGEVWVDLPALPDEERATLLSVVMGSAAPPLRQPTDPDDHELREEDDEAYDQGAA